MHIRFHVATWGVNDVSDWLESVNASVLADAFRGNAVNGVDLLSFTCPHMLAADLHLTGFAARKFFSAP